MTEPVSEDSIGGVIFFNDVGYLGMCGHAMTGTVETLRYLNRIETGTYNFDTPAGKVSATIDEEGNITVANVESYLVKKDVSVDVEGIGEIQGDIAWGGNWFFLVNNYAPELTLENIDQLMQESKAIRKALWDAGETGDGEMVDHIEFFGPSENADSKNFVLCPGNAYDRAPCGTGTSAKIAVLHERGRLDEEEIWHQESITGSIYTCYLKTVDGTLRPFITSKAFVTGRNKLILNPEDPFCYGIK